MFSRKGFWQFFLVSTRLFLGYIFFSAGMAKLLDGHFPGIMGPVWLEAELAKYGLGLFARFIAYSQIIVGLFVLSQRFATIGAIMLFPVIMTTLMVTISLNWTGTPYVLSFFLLLNAILLIADYHKLKFLLTDVPEPLQKTPLQRKNIKLDLVWAIGMICIIASPLLWNVSHLFTYLLIISGLLTFIITWILGRFVIKPENVIDPVSGMST